MNFLLTMLIPAFIVHFLPNSLYSMLALCVYPSWLRAHRGLLAAHRDSMRSVCVRMGSFTCLWLAWVQHATNTVTSASEAPAFPWGACFLSVIQSAHLKPSDATCCETKVADEKAGDTSSKGTQKEKSNQVFR